MVTPVYSKLFVSTGYIPAGTETTLASPPGGYVWVIRSVIAINTGYWYSGLWGLQVYDTEGGRIFGCSAPQARGRRSFSQTMHQTVDAGDFLLAYTNDAGWTLRISGFQLTVPP